MVFDISCMHNAILKPNEHLNIYERREKYSWTAIVCVKFSYFLYYRTDIPNKMATKRKSDIDIPDEESDVLLIRPLWVFWYVFVEISIAICWLAMADT